MGPRRIVVGVDFSEYGRTATAQGMHLARRFGAELVLVHACDSTGLQLFIADRVLGNSEQFRHAMQTSLRAAHRLLEEEYERWRGQGAEVSIAVLDAAPARGLVRAADELCADLVVVGSHGRTGARRMVLGSVAEMVVRAAPCDVLVARNDAGAGGFRRLLVATDLSPVGDAALPVASALAAEQGRIDLVHACPVPAVTGWHEGEGFDAAPLVAELERESESEAALRRRQFRAGLVADVHVAIGPAATIIGRVADEIEPEIVVLASHGRRGLRRALLGSVAERVVRHAPCSVYVRKRGLPEG